MRKKETKYKYWEIQKVENGYLLKNYNVTAVFNDKEELLDFIDEKTE